MTRFIQVHTLTVYPPSNVNRDDSGRPKTARFGGVDRLRISSQAIKRAVRTSPAFKAALDGHLGERTQRLGETIEQHLIGAKGVDAAKAREISRSIAGVFGKIKGENDPKPTHIEQLAFVSPRERLAALSLAEKVAAGETLPAKPADLVAKLLNQFDTAADIAMFGRMLASSPDFNREAAVQVAHAITTHRVDVEDDFFTAVDDLKTKAEDAGAGFIGELGFGSGVFYLYACIDRDLLEKNLGGDKPIAATSISALVEALAKAAPSGKQASFASRPHASYMRIEKGKQQPRTLAAAFLKPIRGEDLLRHSIDAIEHPKTGLAAQMNVAYGACFDTSQLMRFIPGDADNVGSLAELTAFASAE